MYATLTVMQGQTAVTAYFKSKQLLFAFAWQYKMAICMWTLWHDDAHIASD